MNDHHIKLIGSMYMALGRMSENLDRIERLLTASKPQPPRPADPGSTLHAPSRGGRA